MGQALKPRQPPCRAMSRWAQMYQLNREEHAHVAERLVERYTALAEEGELASFETGGEVFRYAVISRDDIASDHGLRQRWVNNYAFGFTVPDGDAWKSFVLAEVPEVYRDIVAAHEYVENQEQDHEKALEQEVAVAREQGTLEGYLAWMEAHYPGLVDDRVDLL